MNKFSSIAMSHQISDSEKEQAEKAIKAFDLTLKQLRLSLEHLDIIYSPFKDNPDISSDQLVKYRAALRRFRDKFIENFNNFKIAAFKCYSLMNMFSSDTQSAKLIKSFIASIEKIEEKINDLAGLFSDLESRTFIADLLNNIDEINKESDNLTKIINDRIKQHLQKNIIGKTWVDAISHQLKTEITQNNPIMMDLLNKKN